MATTSVDQRVLDLAYAGHQIQEIANLLGVSTNHVRELLRNLSNIPVGGASPASMGQRAVDLAYAGHQVPEIADLTGLSENAVRDALRDPTAAPATATGSSLSGAVIRLVYASGSYPARPAGASSVEWVGPVDPGAAARDGDTWIDNS